MGKVGGKELCHATAKNPLVVDRLGRLFASISHRGQ
jgi:hypothetical protein